MSVNDWLDRSGSDERALITILESGSRWYSQLRSEQGYGAGMVAPRGAPTFNQYIEMRIDQSANNLATDLFQGITLNADIMVGDIIRCSRTDGGYDKLRVTGIERIGRVSKVSLHYGS